MNEITIFKYESKKVRTVIRDGEPWFVLKDVCEALCINNNRMVAERLDEDDVSNTDTIHDNLGRKQNMRIISESGLYNVILLSRKPEAKRFKKWITSEVLPEIRKTGSYLCTPRTYIQALEALLESEKEKERLKQEKNELQIELDESKEYFTVKRVAKINRISWKSLNWRKLKNVSQAMEREIRKVFDANFETVNAYHIDVWMHEYPELQYSE